MDQIRIGLQSFWRLAADDLGFVIRENFEVPLPSGRGVVAAVFVPSFGAANGMLIVSEFSDIEAYAEELVEAGYGYSVMDAPSSSERYDQESFVEILRDWGWSGLPSDAPVWLRGNPDPGSKDED